MVVVVTIAVVLLRMAVVDDEIAVVVVTGAEVVEGMVVLVVLPPSASTVIFIDAEPVLPALVEDRFIVCTPADRLVFVKVFPFPISPSRSEVQTSTSSGSVPKSTSVASPENTITAPALKISPSLGEVMVTNVTHPEMNNTKSSYNSILTSLSFFIGSPF